MEPLDLVQVAQLDFQAPDEARFPCLRLAREAMAAGQTASVVLNAANEVAVDAFLNGQAKFTDIPALIESVLGASTLVDAVDIDTILRADEEARVLARRYLGNGKA